MCALACLLQSLPWPRRSCLNLLTLQCARQQKYRHPSLFFRGTPVFPPTHTSPLRHRGVTPMPCLRAPPPYHPPWFLPQGVREREREEVRLDTHTHTRTHDPGPTPFQHSTPRVLACADHTTPATDWLDRGCLLLPCAGQHTSWQPHAYCRSLSAVVSACCPAMCMFVYVFQQFSCVSVC